MAKEDKKIADPVFAGLSEADVDRIAAKIVQQTATRRADARDADTWPVGTRVSVRRVTGGEFVYGGRVMDRNQVFELTGLRLDGRLGPLGYVQRVESDARLETCGTCGAQLTEAASATAHYEKRHAVKTVRRPTMETRRPGETPAEYEERESAWLREQIAAEHAEETRHEMQEDQRAPLHLDQTVASRQK